MRGKRVIITGASGAIGSAIADVFYSHGYELILLGRSVERLNELKDKIYKDHNKGNVYIAYYNAKDGKEEELLEDLIKKYSNIDILINGAGIGYYESLVDLDDEIAKDVFEVNFFAPLRFTKAFLRKMQRPLWVINILSISSKLPVPFSGIYAASKSALYMEMESARGEVSDDVKIINILPGRIESEFSKHAPGTKYFSHGGKRARPEELAKVVYDAFKKEKREVIWPPKYKYILYIQRLFPDIYIRKMNNLKKIYEGKK